MEQKENSLVNMQHFLLGKTIVKLDDDIVFFDDGSSLEVWGINLYDDKEFTYRYNENKD